ncbi:MAG: hypothetical protein J5973_01080, partial [Eubacterium sp.]|nr:hypothetical protein [Eubacterium sp.]
AQIQTSDQKYVHSKDIKKILEERRAVLERLIKEKQESLKNAPDGTLRISRYRNKRQYYQRKKQEAGGGVYIPQDQTELICRLAQKSYDEKVLREAEKERSLLQKVIVYYTGQTVDTVYDSISEKRKELVEPIEKSTEEYTREWCAFEYKGREFAPDAPEHYTDRGERVRSKSEVIIANILSKNRIPYRYECPLNLEGIGPVYPDFTILRIRDRKELYYEHLGMMDDPVYAEKAVRKLYTYMANGIYLGENLILTAETKQQPLNGRIVQEVIERYC